MPWFTRPSGVIDRLLPLRSHLPLFFIALAALLLAAIALLPLQQVEPVAAASDRPSLSNVGISPANSSGPGSPPVTISPGGQFKAWFYINNPGPDIAGVSLAATIRDSGGHEYHNSSGTVGTSCQVPGNVTGYLCSIAFGVPSSAPPGNYSVHFSAGSITPFPVAWGDSLDRSNWLIIQGPPTPTPTPVPPTPTPGPHLCISPTSLDFGDSGTSSTFSIHDCGGPGLTWNVSANQPWISVSPASGTGDAAITVKVDRSGMGEGTHGGVVSVSSNGGSGAVSVSLRVNNQPILCLSRTSIDFGSGNNTDSFAIHNCGGGTLVWFINSNQGWLSTNTNSGTGDAVINVSVNRSGLGSGRYAGVISVDAGSGPQSVSIAMQVSSNPPLAGQVSGLAINPTSVNAGGTASLTANVQNTGTSTGVFHLFTASDSVCGWKEWAGTLNPGQTGQAAIRCDVPASAGTGNYYIAVGFEMSYPGQAYQNKSSAGNLVLGVLGSGPVPPDAPSQYFPETKFWVHDFVPYPDTGVIGRIANFYTEFKRLGGLATLGYPASRSYFDGGFMYQVFQRGILQYRTDYDPQHAVLANTMDWLHNAGKDDFLYGLGIPRHFTGDDGAGGNFDRAKQVRFGWLTDPAIRDAYFANPSPGQIPDYLWDPVTFYGLPTSLPERHGAFTTQRFQRYVFQKWEQSVPGMPAAGTVVGVLAGDLAKQAGLVPGPAMQAEQP